MELARSELWLRTGSRKPDGSAPPVPGRFVRFGDGLQQVRQGALAIAERERDHTAYVKMMASTSIQPTITSEATAPAAILAISLGVYGRSTGQSPSPAEAMVGTVSWEIGNAPEAMLSEFHVRRSRAVGRGKFPGLILQIGSGFDQPCCDAGI